MEGKVVQPQWIRPKPIGTRPVLKLFNSLTRNKEEFVPIKSNKVTWYSCGPTVYDSSHMGHARNYVTTDINRRLIEDYFGFHVDFVQNVTDIDDKIIVRARQNYLFQNFAKSLPTKGTIDEPTQARARRATEEYAQSAFANIKTPYNVGSSISFEKWMDSLDKDEVIQTDPKFPMNATAVLEALKGLENAGDVNAFTSGVEGVMRKALDKELGSTVADHGVFRSLSSFYEADFDSDMSRLNVRPATVTTRVSEYVPEIVDFVDNVIEKGYAYTAQDGSVYFDVARFEAAPGHDYAKLQPWNKGVQELIDEGEGSLSLELSGKKNKSDFALWKSSKPGEPSWESPWGQGRPGWHIECSVMASYVLGSQIDIHSGGIDLAFPHHDNELAQTEARFDEPQWINYFLHTGHLHIEGQKMSKSLKNFITIKEALENYTPRQLRLAFALQTWNTQLDFRSSLPGVKPFESSVSNFFNTVKALARDQTATTSKKVDQIEIELLDQLAKTQEAVDVAFADNLNTPLALQTIAALVQRSNDYVNRASAAAGPKIEVLESVARWISRILRVLGFEMDKDYGWAPASTGDSGGSAQEAALPFIQILAKFRDEVRKIAMTGEAPNKELLALSDRIRDTDLLNAGVSLDDRRDDQAALVKFLTEDEKNEVLTQRREADRLAAEKAARKAEAAKQRDEQERQKREQAKIRPEDLFRNSKEYSAFDEQGLPTHDAAGEPLSKSSLKKLQKQLAAQDKLYKQYKD